jgi:translation initiation factor IF-3
MQKSKKQHLINKEIRGTEVRISDVGIMPLSEALTMAESQDMDLVLINSNAQPPVCKIMNYEKFLYEQSKKDKPKVLELKEIKVGPNTSENDLTYRIKQISEFLGKGHKVKISMQFKGREMIHVTKGETLILKLLVDLEEYGVAEAMPKLEGKRMFVTIKPFKK